MNYSKVALLCVVLGFPASARAQGNREVETLTVRKVVELAREGAPEVRIARTRVLEAQGRLAGARILAENPEIEGVANTDDRFERRIEWEMRVPFGLGLERRFRVRAARAELDRERFFVADAQRLAVGVALAAYYHVLHAERSLALARERLALADELVRTVEERFRTGDAARLDVNVAETERSRARGGVHSSERRLAEVRGALAASLGFPSIDLFRIEGNLEDRTMFDLADRDTTNERRADVLAAQSGVRAASEAVSLARTALLPDLAVRVDRGHEEGEVVTRSGLAVTVPLFDHGQADRKRARAERDRASVEVSTRLATARSEAEAGRSAYRAAVSAAGELRDHGVPRAIETLGMAEESFRAGKIDLAAFLLVRGAALEAQQEHLDKQLEAALSGIDLMVATEQVPAPEE